MAKLIVGINDLNTLMPQVASEWHPTRNDELTPQNFTKSSHHKAHWLGNKCGHSWSAKISERTRGSGCNICSGKNILIGFNDLSTTHPKIANDWHPLLNGNLVPQDFSKGSAESIHWLGKECGHTWLATIHNRVKGRGCSICSTKSVLVVGVNDLATTTKHVASEWHPTLNGNLTPQDFTKGSAQKIHWLGKECGHSWYVEIKNRVRGTTCPICSGRQVLSGFNDFVTTEPEIAREWHPTLNGDIRPETLIRGSSQKAYWLGKNCGHTWLSTIHNRTTKGRGCSVCSTGKQEKAFIDAFAQLSNLDFETTKISDLPRKLRKSHFIQIDGLNVDKKIIIEFDGEWTHGRENPTGDPYGQKLAEDADTTETLLNAGYKVIRIREQHPARVLDLVEVNSENLTDSSLVNNLYQVEFKGNSFSVKQRDSIDDAVRAIIEVKQEWFIP